MDNKSLAHASFVTENYGEAINVVARAINGLRELIVASYEGPDAEHFARLTCARLNGQLPKEVADGQ